MEIVDTHTHVVSPDLERYPLSPAGLPGAWFREAPHSADDLARLMSDAGVARAVLVQGVGAYSYDNRYAADAARADPARFFSACCVDPAGPDPVAELRRWVGDAGMQGARFFALSRDGEPSWLARPESAPLWEAARELGIQVIATLFTHQFGELDAVLARYPDVPVSLDHCGFPAIEPALEESLEPLLSLAHHENLHLKISTHVLDAAERHDASAAVVELLNRRFGASRLMWGSDFCQTYDRPYAKLVEAAHRAFAALSTADREQALSKTALSLWGSAR